MTEVDVNTKGKQQRCMLHLITDKDVALHQQQIER
jgi:hypothetical protein